MENKERKFISVFEHQVLLAKSGTKFTPDHLGVLQNFYGESGCSYFSLVNNGIRFCEYVGVLQVGNLIIEILPKADNDGLNKDTWRTMLVEMLWSVGLFSIDTPGKAILSLKSGNILDLYFDLFFKEIEYLLNEGLLKKYRKSDGNLYALKGSLLFNRHVKYNMFHQERFYVRYTVYDSENVWNLILLKALNVIKVISKNAIVRGKACALLIQFPDFEDIKIDVGTFEKLLYNRKTERYRNAIQIARLILLNFYPDVKIGKNDVFSLMFDMNLLWEKFVYVSLKKYARGGCNIEEQVPKSFWKPVSGRGVYMKPDIVVNRGKPECVVFDTKWKRLGDKNASVEDLRQLYVYGRFFGAQRGALVYPGKNERRDGSYFNEHNNDLSEKKFGIEYIAVCDNIIQWQKKIAQQLLEGV